MARATADEWIDEFRARIEIANAMSFWGPAAPEASELFHDALRDGDLPARLRRYGPDDVLQKWGSKVPPEYWEKHDPIHWKGGVVEIHRPTLKRWLSSGKKGAGRRPGRKPKWDWDGMLVEAEKVANESGLPDVKERLVDKLVKWFDDTYGDSPYRGNIRKKIRPLYERE